MAQPKIKANGDDATKNNNGTATVFVGCKLPHGLICELGVGTTGHRFVKLMGGRTNKLLGIGVTRAPADFMTRWLKDNKDLDFVKSKQIWLADSEDDVIAGGVAILGMQTGFEALDGGQVPKDIEVDSDHLKKMGVSVKGVA